MGGIYTAWSTVFFGIVPPDFISLNPQLNYVFTLFSFYILYISIVNSSIDSEYLFLSHFCKAGKCSFCVFLLVASNYLVQCGILIVPVSCDCSVSLCGNPDVFMYYKVNCGDRFVCVLTFLKKCLDKSRHTCKCTSECRCAGVFVVNEGETSQLASKKRQNISI